MAPSLLAARDAALPTAAPVQRRSGPLGLCLAAALLAALGAAAMPALHRWAVGVARVQDAAVAYVERALGRELSASQVALVHQAVLDQSPALAGAASFVVALLAVALGGAVLATVLVLLDGRVSAGWTLAAAAAGHAAVVAVRIVLWCTVYFIEGADAAAAVEWLHVAPVSLGSALGRDPTGLLGSTLYSLDLSLVIGVVLVAAILTEGDSRLGWTRATLAALAFPAVVVAWRAGMSYLLGVPLA